jgi:uncharacterized repeat protein (TIGR03803 family)
MKDAMTFSLSGWKNACATFLLLAVATIGSSAQTFKTLVSFNGGNGTGASGSPIQAFDGNYYGTTGGGVANCPNGSACGTIYRLSPGKMTTVYTFCLQSGCPDGSAPFGLIQASDGNLYGLTAGGGENGGGTFFRMSLSGKLTSLYSFCAPSSCGYGNVPTVLVQGSDTSFYGTTQLGGAYGYGAIVRTTPTGKLTTLHSFNLNDGASPIGGLIQGANGNLYGTTSDGGNLNCNWGDNFWGGCGTIFELTPKGSFRTLYSFCPLSCADGADPQGNIVEDAGGNLYGTTTFGGFGYAESQCDPVGCGTVFKLNAQGQLSPLYTFCTQGAGICADGFWPGGGLTLGSNGNLYGSAPEGGLWVGNCSYACGTLFSVTPDGAFSVLHAFDDTDGAYPYYAPTQATDGVFLGESSEGGSGNSGTLFSSSMSLPAFVETNPASGKIGTAVVIMGNILKGSTAVTFNGTPAQFRVAANSAIVATVPNGATSGLVSVTTPSGTLTSNAAFTVRP